MTRTEDDLDEELRKLGVAEDNDDYDSDVTPTNSPPAGLKLPYGGELLTNYPSSKTSGFWEDANLGRYSQVSNYSTGSDSSLSWGEDNFEGEATRQVSLLFEQLDDLLYQEKPEGSLNFSSYPVVPLSRSRRQVQKVELKRKNSTLAEQILAARASISETEDERNSLSERLYGGCRKVDGPGNSRHAAKSVHHSADYDYHNDSDSGDEVVWETLSKAKRDPSTITNQKLNSKKLSTIVEQVPKARVRSNKEKVYQNYKDKHGAADDLDDVQTASYSESDCESEDDGAATSNSDSSDSIGSYNRHPYNNPRDGTLPQVDRLPQPRSSSLHSGSGAAHQGSSSHHRSDGTTSSGAPADFSSINLPGGIYAMGFAAPSSQATSPLLLPTPTSPPGVPVQPTPLMKEECSYWSSRFLHLRVRGHAIDPLRLVAMESYAFSSHDENVGSLSAETTVDHEEDTEEEVFAMDGVYDSNTAHLCLIGLFLPTNPAAAGARKPSYDSLPTHHDRDTSALYPSINSDSNVASSQRRVCSGSTDPAVLKEQVLMMLFDSLWPQVMNVVGGLVHRYACHLVTRTNLHGSAQSRDSGAATARTSRMADHGGLSSSGGADYWRRPSTSKTVFRRPSTTNTLVSEGSLHRSSEGQQQGRHSLRARDHREDDESRVLEHGEEVEASVVTPLRPSSAAPSRLHTARTLMQLQRSPLSPVSSAGRHVVSLPALEVPPPHRPLSSVSSLSSISSYRHSALSRNRFSSLTLDIDSTSASTTSPPLSVGGASPSPPWTKAPSIFLPPISGLGSPSLSAANSSVDVSRLLSPKSRDYHPLHRPPASRLARRNSDSMAKVKILPSLR